MTLPRVLEPGTTYLVTRRCLERRFRLRPEQAVNDLLYYADVLPRLATRLTREEIVALTPRDWVAARVRARAAPGSEVPNSGAQTPPRPDTG